MHNNVSWIIEYQALSHLLVKKTKPVYSSAMGMKFKKSRLHTRTPQPDKAML
jgi:hypothetical protein